MILIALLGFFFLCAFVQCFYYVYYFSSLPSYHEKTENIKDVPASVVVAAKNESENLQQFLPEILNQEYKNYEVLVINNHSTDQSEEVLNSFKNNRLRVFSYSKKKGKKAAIHFGVEQAKFENLIFTDADCKVASLDWLRLMVQQLVAEKEIIIGHARFFKEKGFLNKVIRFENFLNALQSFSFALHGKAYTAIGRNMGYKKELFLRSNSFKKHDNLISGDDDLIVNEMADSDNVAISINPLSHTFSKAEKGFVSYFNQRRRQLQAGAEYKIVDKVRLAVFGATNFIYYLLFVILVVRQEVVLIILGIFVLKQGIQFFTFNNSAKKLGDKDLIKWIPILEPIYMFIIAIIGISTWLRKVDKWK